MQGLPLLLLKKLLVIHLGDKRHNWGGCRGQGRKRERWERESARMRVSERERNMFCSA